MNLLKSKLFLLVLILLFSIQSCAEMKSWVSPKRSVQGPATAKHTSQTSKNIAKTKASVRDSSQETGQEQAPPSNLASKYMKAGEYQKAIDLYNDDCRKQPQNLSLMKEYAKSLDGIRLAAENTLVKGDAAASGRLYYILQNNYSKFHRVENMLSFNNTYLNKKLDYCRKTLSKQGFEEYRKGNLNEAIILWQGLLAIDPDNKDIKQTVRTATQQQKNLQVRN